MRSVDVSEVMERLVEVAVPVAITFATLTFPEKSALPCTLRAAEGEVVPSPKKPAALMTEAREPEVLYISMMFALCPEAGSRARVVVAVDPERTASFAYGDEVAPIATRYVVVDRVMTPPFTVSPEDVHPPPEDAPPTEIVPHETLPEGSV